MRRLAAVLLALFWAMACEEPEPESRIAADVVALGYEKFECGDEIVPAVYARLDTMALSREVSCAALNRAIAEVRTSERVPVGVLNPDSVILAVVNPVRVARAASVDSGYQVYIDLEHRSHYLFISWLPGSDRAAEVSWAPEGLTY